MKWNLSQRFGGLVVVNLSLLAMGAFFLWIGFSLAIQQAERVERAVAVRVRVIDQELNRGRSVYRPVLVGQVVGREEKVEVHVYPTNKGGSREWAEDFLRRFPVGRAYEFQQYGSYYFVLRTPFFDPYFYAYSGGFFMTFVVFVSTSIIDGRSIKSSTRKRGSTLRSRICWFAWGIGALVMGCILVSVWHYHRLANSAFSLEEGLANGLLLCWLAGVMVFVRRRLAKR